MDGCQSKMEAPFVEAAIGLSSPTRKVVRREEIGALLLPYRQSGRCIVFTNGCFDILHVGHTRYLQAARDQGDMLVIGLNSDRSVRKLKGPERPINSQDDRAEILASLTCVDLVCVFDEQTPNELIEIVRPSIHVKGGDYRPEDLPEAEVVHRHGGKVMIMPLVSGRSTSIILGKLSKP